jgi:hypothetical protein
MDPDQVGSKTTLKDGKNLTISQENAQFKNTNYFLLKKYYPK